MRIRVLLLKQDEPKKCTAQKLIKFGLAKEIKKISKNSLVLNPFADKILLQTDKKIINSITGIDCSWKLADQIFVKQFPGIHRKLPPIFAGNPVNYSKIGKLTTMEAIAGACLILGLDSMAMKLLDKFKWGNTFFQLNKQLLKDYSQLRSEDQIVPTLDQYNIKV